ncbi:MAG: YfiR family protein [Rhizobacter sp.]
MRALDPAATVSLSLAMSPLISHHANAPRRSRRHGLRRLGGWAALWVVMTTSLALQAEPLMPAAAIPTPVTDEAKAAHLHRFSGFVEWPASSFSTPDSPITVGVVGSPGVQKELMQIVAGRLVQGRPLQVVELAEPRQVPTVHMLMVGRAAKRAGEWIGAAKGSRVLVVTDVPLGLERGAALCFLESEGRLRFEASVPAAEAAGVRLSSRLLSLAERVVRAP